MPGDPAGLGADTPLARPGIVVDGDAGTQLKLGAAGVVIAVYYALALAVERRWPAVGRFLVALGLRRTPATYGKVIQGRVER